MPEALSASLYGCLLTFSSQHRIKNGQPKKKVIIASGAEWQAL